MRLKVVALALVFAQVGACRGRGGKGKRTGSAAPVEVVAQPDLPDAGGHGPGPTIDEIEPNDGDEVGTPLPIGSTGRGKLETDSDVDYFRVEVDRPGTLQVALSGIEGMDLALELADASGAVVAKSDRGGPRVKEGFPNAGVTQGRYALIVKHSPKK